MWGSSKIGVRHPNSQQVYVQIYWRSWTNTLIWHNNALHFGMERMGLRLDRRTRGSQLILRRWPVHVGTGSWLVYPVLMQLLYFFYISKPAEECLAQCYSVEVYNKIYDHCMMPMNGINLWPEDTRRPKPPAYAKMPGRPRKERRREHGEAKKVTKVSKIRTRIKCSKCH